MQATVPIANLAAIPNNENANLITMPRPHPASHGTGTTSEGTHVMDSHFFNGAGYAGRGIKVTVFDSGFDISNPEISGNIAGYGSFDSSRGMDGFYTRHGTAAAKVVVDMAPDVELYLHNIGTDMEYYNLVDYLIGRGYIDIITMSMDWENHNSGNMDVYEKWGGLLGWGLGTFICYAFLGHGGIFSIIVNHEEIPT